MQQYQLVKRCYRLHPENARSIDPTKYVTLAIGRPTTDRNSLQRRLDGMIKREKPRRSYLYIDVA